MIRLFVVALAVFVGGCRTTQDTGGFELKANGNSVGQFMGLDAVSKTISSRMLNQTGFQAQNFSLRRYLPGNNFGFGSGDLGELLGQYVVVNGNGEFKNGTPNAMNMALWYLVMNRLATDVATVCLPEPVVPPTPTPAPVVGFTLAGIPGIPFTETFEKKVKTMCAWPAEDAKKEETMLAYWTAIMGFQAPKAAFTAWRDWFLAEPSFAALPPEVAVREMTVAIFLQPHFLLSK